MAEAEVGSREPDIRAADAPPSRYGEGDPLPPPVAVDRRGLAAGSSSEVTPWSGDGVDRRMEGSVGDRRISEEDRPPPSSGCKLKSRSPIGDNLDVDDDNDEGDNEDDRDGDDDNEDGGNDDDDDDTKRGKWMGRGGSCIAIQ